MTTGELLVALGAGVDVAADSFVVSQSLWTQDTSLTAFFMSAKTIWGREHLVALYTVTTAQAPLLVLVQATYV